MEYQVADSFQGGVSHGGAGPGDARARVAIHGTSLQALTGGETFRIPLARCSLERAGGKILVRDEQGSLVIWSDDEAFLEALERVQRGTLQDQVRGLRRAARRRRLLRRGGAALIAAGALAMASAPLTRWAVRGGVPSLAGWIGESALQRLAFPTGLAPTVERELVALGERLRPAAAPGTRSFRVLLADYTQVHSFSLPPDAVVVTSGLVCAADGPDLVMAAVAREIAHLENRDVSGRVAEAVDWTTAPDLLRGDATRLRARMLDFASPRRSPGFTPEQETAASDRASSMLGRVGVAVTSGDPAALLARLKGLALDAPEKKPEAPPAARPPPGGEAGGAPPIPAAVDWSKVRAEACELIGR
jgi:hypothetical protein